MFVLEEIISKKEIEADCQVLFQKCFHFLQSKESDRWGTSESSVFEAIDAWPAVVKEL